jgi:hypothetical protein
MKKQLLQEKKSLEINTKLTKVMTSRFNSSQKKIQQELIEEETVEEKRLKLIEKFLKISDSGTEAYELFYLSNQIVANIGLDLITGDQEM